MDSSGASPSSLTNHAQIRHNAKGVAIYTAVPAKKILVYKQPHGV